MAGAKQAAVGAGFPGYRVLSESVYSCTTHVSLSGLCSGCRPDEAGRDKIGGVVYNYSIKDSRTFRFVRCFDIYHVVYVESSLKKKSEGRCFDIYYGYIRTEEMSDLDILFIEKIEYLIIRNRLILLISFISGFLLFSSSKYIFDFVELCELSM
jgi:hypothetical protein